MAPPPEAGGTSGDGEGDVGMLAAPGTPAASAPRPITDRIGGHAGAAAGTPEGHLSALEVASPSGDDDSLMDVIGDAAAAALKSVRFSPPPPGVVPPSLPGASAEGAEPAAPANN